MMSEKRRQSKNKKVIATAWDNETCSQKEEE